MTFTGIFTRTAERYVLIKRAVVAYLGSFAYYNAASVVDEQALSYRCAGVYLYTRFSQSTL